MPKSGAMAPYVVVNRDAAIAGVFSVDGEAGAIVLTSKYLQISNYTTDKAATDASINSINESIGNINTALDGINTTLNTKAAKGANNDITELNALTKAITFAQGGTGAKTSADARKNLEIDRISQFPSETLLRAPATATYFTVGGSAWGVYDSIATTWKPLGIGQGGTGGKTQIEARENLQLNRFIQLGSETHLISPDSSKKIFLSNTSWGAYDNVNKQWLPLPVANGGTGALDAPGARRNIGGQWEETQQYLNSEAIVLRRPNATTNQWIAFYRETNNAAFRFGHESTDQLATHSYNTDGTYRKKINQISANGDTSIFGSLSLDGNLTSAGEGVIGRISVHRNRFPQVNLWASDRTDVGAYLRIEIAPQVGGAPYFFQMYRDNDSTGGFVNTLPRTAGTLAVQGTSGREYKKDISLADSNEALSRVTSLEMVNFVYKDDEKQRVRFGVIAEDAEKIAPQYVKHNQFPIPGTEVFDDEGNKIGEEYQDRPSIDVNPIVMDLLGCVQAQQKQIDELKELVKQLLAK